uniref:CD7 molecule n=1 Tax=Coturnix japonica TaxID=93934 RepID=A0A8C2YHB0_COTJA
MLCFFLYLFHSVLYEAAINLSLFLAKTNGVIEQSPQSVSTQQGESINITCVLKSSHEDEEIMLLKIHMQLENVLCVSSQNTSTISPTFANRLECSKQEEKLVITLHNLQESDTDIYVCAAALKNSSLTVSESGTMLLVKGTQYIFSQATRQLEGKLAPFQALFLMVSCFVLQMKNFFQKKKINVVYEDMSFSSRSNTLVRTNTYSNNN